ETKHYNDFSTWLRHQLGCKVQKISIDAGFSCPNRDGTLATGGCVFCDNKAFSPAYCRGNKSVKRQVEDGISFFKRKYKDMKYLAYFQAFTNTYAPVEHLKSLYEEALCVEDVVGIVIGTRPDCVSDDILNYLEELNRQTFMIVEYGIESTDNKILKRINRGHNYECSVRAIERTKERDILVGGHVILGLPGMTEEDSIMEVERLNNTQLDILKLHQLQVVKDTRLAEEYLEKPFKVFNIDEYIRLVATLIQHIRPDMILDRFISQSPAEMLIAPKWGIKNYEFANALDNYLTKNNIYQGA
ncbi:MAG: TIGR01212 family radical SAM protein, partial [Prevotella sp.]|nr:TIGR01212 family radical SAM protein [Prevotella sp.]